MAFIQGYSPALWVVAVVVLVGIERHLQAEVMRGPVEYFEKHPGFGFDPPPRRRCFVPVLPGTRQVDTVVVVEVLASEEIVVVTTLGRM